MAGEKDKTAAPARKRNPRPVYVALQILNEQDQPVKFAKDQINVVTASQNAGVILDVMESGEHPFVLYKKVTPVS